MEPAIKQIERERESEREREREREREMKFESVCSLKYQIKNSCSGLGQFKIALT